MVYCLLFFFSSRRRHTRLQGDWSSDVCSSDLTDLPRSGPAYLVGEDPSRRIDAVKDVADIVQDTCGHFGHTCLAGGFGEALMVFPQYVHLDPYLAAER